MNEYQWVHKSLLKKELRQLLPLTIAVLCLCLAVVIGLEVFPDTMRSSGITGGYALLLMPSLFAVGAGAMSIGQEKETRTLMWLASLPLSPLTVIRTKAIAAILILAFLWTVVFAFGFLADRMNLPLQFAMDNRHPLQTRWAWHWVLHSIYLLCCGYLAAWRMPSAMAGLVVVMPLALVPTMLRFIGAYVLDPGHRLDSAHYDASWLASILSIVACLIPTMRLMHRFAFESFSPAVSKAVVNPYAAVIVASDLRKRTTSSVPGPATALLWHFFRQNQWMYLSVLSVCVVLSLTCLILESTNTDADAFTGLTITIIASCVAASWMGVMVFQGDRVRNQNQFLADRGVSPSLVWIMRHLLPLAFIGLMTWLYVFFLHLMRDTDDFVHYLPVWVVFGSLLLFYVYGQWFSQMTRHPAVSVIGAPVLGFVATLTIVYAAVQVMVPYASLSMVLIAPMLATFMMMKRWMDGRLQWPFWATHIGLIAFAALIPVAWVLMTISQIPRMPPAIRAKFEAPTLAHGSFRVPVYVPLFSSHEMDALQFRGTTNELQEQSFDYVLNLNARLDQLRELTKQSGSLVSGISIDTQHVNVVLGEIELAKARLQRDATDQATIKQFQQNFDLLMLTAIGLRQASELIQQDQADACEILLLAYMKQASTKQWLTDELWSQAVSIVANRDGRAIARKRALIHTWQELDRKISHTDLQISPSFKGYWSLYPTQGKLMTQWTLRPRLAHLASTLMRLLETGQGLSEEERVALLRQRWPFEGGDAYMSLRIDDPADAFSQLFHQLMSPVLPGEQWFAGWEEVGASMGKGE